MKTMFAVRVQSVSVSRVVHAQNINRVQQCFVQALGSVDFFRLQIVLHATLRLTSNGGVGCFTRLLQVDG